MKRIFVCDSKGYGIDIFSKSLYNSFSIIKFNDIDFMSILNDQAIVFVVYEYVDLFDFFKLKIKYPLIDLVIASHEMIYVLKKTLNINFFTIDQYIKLLKDKSKEID